MSVRPYAAELLGTFVLSLVVALPAAGEPRYAAVYAAPIVVALFVYSVGWISGAHLNPAVTIGLASIKRIGAQEAVYYVLAQLLGAFGAMVVCNLLLGAAPSAVADDSARVIVGEAMGAFLLVWAIMAVAERKVHAAASGIAIGFGLLVGILIASSIGTNGALNPAVAFALNSLSISYLVGPIVGALGAAWAYRALAEPEPASQPVH